MPVPVFCCFCIPEKLVWKYSRNWTKLHGGPYFTRTHLKDRRSNGEEPGGPHTHPGRGSSWHALGWCGPLGALQPPPFRLLIPPDKKNPKYPSHIARKVSEAPPSSTLAREGPEPLPGTLPERGIVTGCFYIAMPASGVMRE